MSIISSAAHVAPVFQIPGHRLPQKSVDSGLISRTLGLQLCHDVSVKPNGNRLLEGAVKLPNHGLAPVGQFGNIRGVDLAVPQLCECS